MATTQNTYTGNNSTTEYSFTFPYLEESDVKVSLDGVDQATTAYSFANATTISFDTAPGNNVAIRIYRVTDTDEARTTFFAGSAIRAQDLNDNNNQLLYSTQETVNRRVDKTGDTMTGDLTLNNADLVFEGTTEDAFETTLTVVDPTADRTITLPNVTGTVVTTGDTGTVATAMIAADAVNGTKIADDSIDSEHYVDASIDTAHIADAQITTAKIAADAVTNAKIADDSIDSEHYVDGSIDTAHIADLQVTTAKIAADAVTNAKIADDSIDSEHYVDGSIDTAHIADSQVTTAKIADANVTTAKITDANVTTAKLADSSVTTAKIANSNVTTAKIADANVTTAKIAADAIDGTKLADNAVDSEHYTDGSIDRVHLAADIVDGTKIADDAIDSEHYVDQSIDAAHLATDSVTTGKINADAITNAKIADNAVQAENINGLTATIAELNQLDGNTLSNSSVDWTSGTTFPSASQISARLEAFGGFEAIADDESFPNTAPAEGVIISIANAGGLTVNASGTSTNGDTLDDTTVTINNFPSGFNSTTLDDGIGLLVVATSTAHTYNFHRVVAKDEDVRQLSSDINDFKARYRVGTENPTTDNDAGDLFFNTDSDKLLVRNGANTAWEEAQSIGEFFIIPASDFPTWNGTLNDISITNNAPASAEQIVLSINGVIQEPNSGTARPTDGFSLNGSTIQLSDAPATGSEAWGVILGSTVNIGTPSAGTVGTTQLADGGVTTAKIAADAVNGTKIADDSIDSEHYVDGSIDTAHLADDAVTAAKLADTAVTAGSYTLSSITVDAQGRITAASSGTAADPDIITEGNTSVEVVDTGSDGEVRLTTEGTRAMTIDSSQRVGIGTESPNTGSQLHVVGDILITGTNSRFNAGIDGSASNPTFVVNDGDTGMYRAGANALGFTTGGTAAVTIDSSQRVGIGTTTPDTGSTLHVDGGRIRVDGGNTFTIGGVDYVIGLTAVDNGTSINLVDYYDGSSVRKAGLATGNSGGSLVLSTRTSAGTSNESVVIDSDGNVGIDTDSPVTMVQIGDANSGNGNPQLRLHRGSGSDYLNVDCTAGSATLDIVGGGNINIATGGTDRAQFDANGNFRFNSGYGSVATAYGVRAWVNFNGAGTLSIRDDGNVTSVTDNGTGDYTINFTNSMPDVNYATILTTSMGNSGVYAHVEQPNTGSVRIRTKSAHHSGQTSGTYYDTQVYAAIVR